MAKVVGTVQEVVGEVKVTTAEGNIKFLQLGDKIYEGDNITAMSGSQTKIAYTNGQEAIIESNTNFLVADTYENSSVEVATVDATQDNVTVDDVTALLNADNPEDATAVGEVKVSGGTSGGLYNERLEFGKESFELGGVEFDNDRVSISGAAIDQPQALETVVEPEPEPENFVPSITPSSNTVYEEGLTSDANTSENATGTFTITSIDGVKSITVGGIEIQLSELQDSSNNPIPIDTGDESFNGQMTINGYDSTSGVVNYSYKITDNTLEHDINSNTTIDNNDTVTDTIELKVTDTDGDTSTSNLTINIVDDVPTSTDHNKTLTFSDDNQSTTNVLFTLDVSGSMSANKSWGGPVILEDGTETTRLEIAKESIINTIDAYANNGDVNVNLTLFNSGANNIGWMTADEAKSYISDLTMETDGYIKYQDEKIDGLERYSTDYKDGLDATETIDFSGHSADNTVAYFLSDGKPNLQTSSVDDKSDTDIKEWAEFIDTNNIDLNVIGIGNKVSGKYLDLIQVQDEKSPIIISDETELNDALLSTVTGTIYGDVDFGADGGEITSVEIDGTTYDAPSDGSAISAITTSTGGVLDMNFSSGHYTFTANEADYTDTVQETFKINLEDGDGDTTSLDLNIDFKSVDSNTSENNAPDAVDDGGNNSITLTDTLTSNIVIAESSSINLNGSTDFNISVSVTPDGTQVNYDIIFNKEDSVELAFDNNGNLQFAMKTDNEGWVWHDTDVEYTPNEINNITFSYDGEHVTITNTDTNGDISTFTQDYTGGIIDYGNDLMIGNRPYGGGRYSMDGDIDNVSMNIDGKNVLELNFDGSNPLADSSGYGNDAVLGDGSSLNETTVSTDEDSSITVDVLANDTDADGDSLHVTKIDGQDVTDGNVATITDDSGNTLGTASLTVDGKVDFTPSEHLQEMNDGENQDVTFDYTVSDGTLTDTASVTVNVTGSNDINVINGTDGNDRLSGTDGNDVINAGAGNDTINAGAGDDVITGGEGRQSINAGSGDDTINITEGDGAANYEVVAGGDGNDTAVFSGNREDYTIGHDDAHSRNLVTNIETGETNYINDDVENLEFGDGSYDTSAGTFTDAVVVQNNYDVGTTTGWQSTTNDLSDEDLSEYTAVVGNNSHDTIIGNENIHNYDGEAGNDNITGSSGDDNITGGTGWDTLKGGDGDDTFHVDGNDGQDTIIGGAGNDTILGGDNDDTIGLQNFEKGAVENIDGGEGDNTIQVGTTTGWKSTSSDFSETDIQNVDSINGSNSHDTIIGNENITNYDGGAGNDNITGSSGNDNITGGTGWDTLKGGDGDDTFHVDGNDGQDTIIGGAGNDTILGGDNDDTIGLQNFEKGAVENIDGGAGDNTIQVGTTTGWKSTSSDFSETNIENVDSINGSNSHDTIIGNENIHNYDGGAGNDNITGSSGNDDITGGTGTDTVIFSGARENYTVTQNDDGSVTVEDLRDGSPDGTDTINSVENFKFSDGTVANEDLISSNPDTTAEAPTLNMNISDATVTTTSTESSVNPDTPDTPKSVDTTDAIDKGEGVGTWDTVDGSSSNDTIIAGNDFDKVDLHDGNDSLDIGNAANGWTKIETGNGDNTIEAGNNWNEVKGGSGKDNITVGDGSEKIETKDGNDNLEAGDAGAGYAKVDMGKGDDSVTLGDGWDEVRTGDGADRVQAEDGVTKADLGTGDDSATFGDAGTGYAQIDAGKGDDTVIAGNQFDKINMGEGDDTLIAGDGVQKLQLGDGNDTATVGDANNAWAQIDAGKGDDTVVAGDNYDKVKLGDGDDSLNIGNAAAGWTIIDAGKGNDTMTVGSGFDVIDGGKGDDTVTFKGDASEWTQGERWGDTIVTNNETGEITTLKNVEHIEFGGTDSSASVDTGDTTSTYSYEVTLNAGLTDTDSITSSVTSTESNGGDDTTIANGGAGDDTFITDGSDTIHGGAGTDTISLTSNIDMNFDTISDKVDNIEKIDLSDGDHNITLDLQDIVSISGDDSIFEISGDTSDSVTIEGDWTNVGSTTDGFTDYSSGNMTIQIEDAIQVDIDSVVS